MGKFDLIKKEIETILLNSPISSDPKHAELTFKWVLKLKPDADEAFKISALAHDIDRAITKITEKDISDKSKYNEFKKDHSLRSAKFISEIMIKYNYSSKIIEKVKHLVENHEFGGDSETNILTDADSLAYFEYNIPVYLERNGKDNTKHKIVFMFERMSPKAKALAGKIKFQDKEIEELVKESLSEIKEEIQERE